MILTYCTPLSQHLPGRAEENEKILRIGVPTEIQTGHLPIKKLYAEPMLRKLYEEPMAHIAPIKPLLYIFV
jgi:hypothetical protein